MIDRLDDRIMEILKKDSRRPFVEIANELEVSEGTIRSRVKKLLDEGVIQAFTIKTSSKNVKALVEVKIEVNVNTSEIADRIAEFEGVSEVYEVTGEEDIVVIIDVTSSPQLNEIIERIRRFDNVESTRTRLILKEHFGG
ncbi:MAG TPA: Lrp/AsnC family transcriptional regulator [Methanomassiliicoccales archaeon]|nr:Lrp/AsnC family transcriptional regulator [Euryarchaeota archaeon]HOE52344.1 Lrp/AsnC family transcriptional regulator [Methanomassiliicoccales archaeon]HPD08573.1 Lrp/AsnC family transcriptional regulator [Methanomassiliicoccales archaeon]HQM66570.1 Lrp/AsnC family transcriptional regulator [Methanomassiliicoccales archaeon]HRR66251.1 Lrp/AsnC family transcriptional regulator [Methanomassiliicoccales archaeon]